MIELKGTADVGQKRQAAYRPDPACRRGCAERWPRELHRHTQRVARQRQANGPPRQALAHVALEFSGRPLVVSNVDLSAAHVAGLPGDVVARFLQELAEGAGLTLHVRLIDGEDTQHVLETIFKALGVALAQACRLRRG